MAVVPVGDIYVDANFEVQLGKVRVGQQATLHADIYGSQVTYTGVVAGVFLAARARPLLPFRHKRHRQLDQSGAAPTGAHPARSAQLQAHPLKVGLSMRATIDTRTGGEPAAAAAASPLAQRTATR